MACPSPQPVLCRPEKTAAGSPQHHNPFVQPPQCKTSRRSMVSTGIQTYGLNGTGGISGGLFMVEMSLTDRECRHQVLPNREDGYAVKAILAHDAITHPDHPLRIAGKPGIELFIGELSTYCDPYFSTTANNTFLSGTLENGEARLMFSSEQVEYIRYWLHAMGLTKELIPLPYSDCLLTSSRLQNHSPVVYKSGTELRNALKVRCFPLITVFRAG
jgi:hypothetical protein